MKSQLLVKLTSKLPIMLELIGLALVSVILLTWFGLQDYSKPSQIADSAFEQTLLLGNIQLAAPPAAWTAALCQQSLATKPDDRLATACRYVATGENTPTAPQLDANQQQHFEKLQLAFAQLYQQQRTQHSTAVTNTPDAHRNNLVEQISNLEPNEHLQRELAQQQINSKGSAVLYCGWWLTAHSIGSNPEQRIQDGRLLRSELFTGGYAPYQQFTDRLNVSADYHLGAVLLPQTWAAIPDAQANSPRPHACYQLAQTLYALQHPKTATAQVIASGAQATMLAATTPTPDHQLALSPAQLYLHAQQQLEFFYEQQAKYPKTQQMDRLSQSAHGYVVGLAWLTYLCLWLARQPFGWSIGLATRAGVMAVLWTLAHLLVNRHYPALLDPMWRNPVYWGIGGLSLLSIFWHQVARPRYLQQFDVPLPMVYPAIVLLLGTGFFVLLDWSMFGGYPAKRFIGVSQAQFLFYSFLMMACASLWATTLFAALQRGQTLISLVLQRLSMGRRGLGSLLVMLLVAVLMAGVMGLLLSGQPHITSELFRLLLLLLMAYLISQRSAYGQQLWPIPVILVFCAGLVVLLQVMTSDLGPAMLLAYSMMVLLLVYALHIGMVRWADGRLNQTMIRLPLMLMAVLVGLLLLWQLGLWLPQHANARSQERLLSMQQPFHSSNDQRALLLYFVHSVPEEGYGLNNTPWQGIGRGVPAQTQSDYMPMALYAVLGKVWLTGLLAIYMGLLLGVLARVRRMVGHRSGLPLSPMQHEQQRLQSFYAWFAALWVLFTLMQIVLSFGGNFGLTPLTGISLPLFSFGQVGLLVQALCLGLLLVQHRPYPTRSSSTCA